MKISNKQATLLAQEIFERLSKSNTFKVPAELVSKIKAFKKYRNKLQEDIKKLENELSEHDKKLPSIVGKANSRNIRGYYDEDNILEKLEQANIPSIQQIEDKIILKAMFASEDDMESFVEKMVKEFSTKKVIVN